MKVGEQLCSPNKHHAFDEIMKNVNVSEMTESCMKVISHSILIVFLECTCIYVWLFI